jgi:hypothetical protein
VSWGWTEKQVEWTKETTEEIGYLCRGKYQVDAIETLASIIIENDLPPKHNRVAAYIEASLWHLFAPALDIYLVPPGAIALPLIIDCAIVLAADPNFFRHVKAELDKLNGEGN